MLGFHLRDTPQQLGACELFREGGHALAFEGDEPLHPLPKGRREPCVLHHGVDEVLRGTGRRRVTDGDAAVGAKGGAQLAAAGIDDAMGRGQEAARADLGRRALIDGACHQARPRRRSVAPCPGWRPPGRWRDAYKAKEAPSRACWTTRTVMPVCGFAASMGAFWRGDGLLHATLAVRRARKRATTTTRISVLPEPASTMPLKWRCSPAAWRPKDGIVSALAMPDGCTC